MKVGRAVQVEKWKLKNYRMELGSWKTIELYLKILVPFIDNLSQKAMWKQSNEEKICKQKRLYTETFIETQNNLELQSATLCNCNHLYTVEFLVCNNNSEKKKGNKKYKPYKIPQKLLVTLLLFR